MVPLQSWKSWEICGFENVFPALEMFMMEVFNNGPEKDKFDIFICWKIWIMA